MDFYIFRHAETIYSKNDISYGGAVESAEILPEGIAAIEKMAKYLKSIKTDNNFTSPYKRCLQTVEIVRKITGWKFVTENDLHDYNPQIETIPEMIKRIKNFISKVEAKNFQSIAVCTHGYPISALIYLITKGLVSERDLENYPKTGVLTIIKNRNIEQIDLN